jgi:uncharacterized protein with HEPN domain
MSERRDLDYIEDIREAITRIERYCSNLSREEFEADEKTQDAVIRNLEVIGEATKNLSAATRRENSAIPWKDLAGVRDKLIHHYFGINYAIIWKIIRDDLPRLLPELDEILRTLAAQDAE